MVGLNKSMVSKTSSYKKKQFKLTNKNLWANFILFILLIFLINF